MTKQIKNDTPSTPQPTESDVLVLIKKMHQQLTFLEKKIDILINQSQEKPFREKFFSKPPRTFDRPYRPSHGHDNKDQGKISRERSFHPSHHFKKHQGDENRRPGGPPKNYNDDRKNSSSKDRHFKKEYDSKKRGPGSKKKIFLNKQKGQ